MEMSLENDWGEFENGENLSKRMCIRGYTIRMEKYTKFVHNIKLEGHTEYCGYTMLDKIVPYEAFFRKS